VCIFLRGGRIAWLIHAYVVVSLMAGVRPEEALAIGWEEDVDLHGNPPSVAVLRGFLPQVAVPRFL
jgi:hypothetical protein